MKYAINIADMTTYAQNGPLDPMMLLIQPVLDKSGDHILCEGERWDGVACRVIQEYADNGRFKAVHEFIRKRVRKNQLRIYESKTGSGGWKRV